METSYKSIAIDGPGSAGKSSIAKAIAASLGYIYVDTGALYRAIGLFVSKRGGDTKKSEEITPILNQIHLELKYIDGAQKVFLNHEDVSEEIRLPEVSMYASNVSAHKIVREYLFDMQRDMAKYNDIIMDGRDIGTVVLPNANVKIFLTASSQIRAKRRFDEFAKKGQNVDFDTLLSEIEERDYQDTHRAIAPLKKANDAILVDTSELTLEESIEAVKNTILKALK